VKDFIVDAETGKNVAFVLDGEFFEDAPGTPKIGTMRAGNIYDLGNNLVGHLEGLHVTGLRTSPMPISFRKLLIPRSGEPDSWKKVPRTQRRLGRACPGQDAEGAFSDRSRSLRFGIKGGMQTE